MSRTQNPPPRAHNVWMPAGYLDAYVVGATVRGWTDTRKAHKPAFASVPGADGYKVYYYRSGHAFLAASMSKSLTQGEYVAGTKDAEDKLSYFMTNAHEHSASQTRRVQATLARSPHLKVLQDSGGYQLFSKRTDFIAPESVARAHASLPRGSEGVGLDLPLGLSNPRPHVVERAARFQIFNNNAIRDSGYAGPLFSTSHGIVGRTRVAYLDHLLTAGPTPYLAIAGLRQVMGGPPMTLPVTLATAVYCALRAKPKRIHLLGLGSRVGFLVAHLMRQRFPEITITLDSATYVLMGANGLFVSEEQVHGSFTSAPKTTATSNPCSCSICSRFGSYFNTSLLARGPLAKVHNLLSLAGHGLLTDPVLPTWEAEHGKRLQDILWANLSAAKANLLAECPAPKRLPTSLFDGASYAHEYELRLTHVMDTYKTRLKSGV